MRENDLGDGLKGRDDDLLPPKWWRAGLSVEGLRSRGLAGVELWGSYAEGGLEVAQGRELSRASIQSGRRWPIVTALSLL